MFILSEDKAVKKLFTGLTVPVRNDNDGVPDSTEEVPVRWRYPQSEPRDTAYPFISVTMVSATRDPSREHRGRTDLDYIPDGINWPLDDENENTVIDWPIPMDLYYDISAWTRSGGEGQYLFGQMLRKPLGYARFGEIKIPEEMTLRRVDLMEQSPAQMTIDPFGKRLYKANVVVRVGTELIPDRETRTRVQEVLLDGPIPV